MKNTFLKISGIILLIIVVGLVVLSISLDSTIKVGVETIGPTITGTDVTIDDVNLSLFTGEGQLEKLVIGNPPGFQTDHAFYFGLVQVKADLNSLWSDTIRIQEIFIDSPEISFESTPSGSNLAVIHENIGAFAGSGSNSVNKSGNGKSTQEEGSSEKSTREQKIQIDQFILKNGRVTVSTSLLKDQLITLRLPVVQLRDIGKGSGGVTLKQIASLIYSETQKAIEQEISKSGIPLGGTNLKTLDKKLGEILNEASKFLDGVQGLFEK